MLPRRDSILKHFGSVKSEKRVSIKNDAPIVLEYISEKPHAPTLRPNSSSCSLNGASFDSLTSATGSLATTALMMPANVATTTARPASLILSKSADQPQRQVFKLVRSPSIDRQDSEDTQLMTVTISQPDAATNGGDSEAEVLASVISPAASQASQKHSPDCCDESAPLVLTKRK